MIKSLQKISLFILSSIIITACYTTTVVTQSDDARVFLDGEYQGKGQSVDIPSNGASGDAHIVVKSMGKSNSLKVKRRFTYFTLIGSLYTYGIGLWFFWQLPPIIYAPVEVISGKEFDPGTHLPQMILGYVNNIYAKLTYIINYEKILISQKLKTKN